jgi:hypothetical protein
VILAGGLLSLVAVVIAALGVAGVYGDEGSRVDNIAVAVFYVLAAIGGGLLIVGIATA